MKPSEQIYVEAKNAGLAALAEVTPTPIIVGTAKNIFGGEIDRSKPVFYESEGPCGFAWINIKPGNSAFARYLKTLGVARTDSYYGGVTVWVGEGGQSVERKEAYAYAFAKVLTDNGIRAYANSRLD